MKKFVVELFGGDFGDFYDYKIVVESYDKENVEFMLLESKKLQDDNYMEYLFDGYQIHTLDEWANKNLIDLNEITKVNEKKR